MGIFFQKNFSKVFFKSDGEGRRVFYPWGNPGKGYVVGPAEEVEIEAYLNKQTTWLTVMLLLQIAMQAAVGIGTTLKILGAPYVVFLIIYRMGLRRRTRQLPVSTVRLTRSDVIRNQVQTMSRGRAYALVVIGGIMTLASVITAFRGEGATAWVGVFGALLFGYALIQAIRIVRARWTGP